MVRLRRLSVLGVEVSVADRWLPAESRAGSSAASATGARSVSSGTEVQLLFSQPQIGGMSGTIPSAAEALGMHFCATTSQFVASMNATEVATVLAVGAAISTSVSRGWMTPLEPRIAPPPGDGQPCVAHNARVLYHIPDMPLNRSYTTYHISSHTNLLSVETFLNEISQ